MQCFEWRFQLVENNSIISFDFLLRNASLPPLIVFRDRKWCQSFVFRALIPIIFAPPILSRGLPKLFYCISSPMSTLRVKKYVSHSYLFFTSILRRVVASTLSEIYGCRSWQIANKTPEKLIQANKRWYFELFTLFLVIFWFLKLNLNFFCLQPRQGIG